MATTTTDTTLNIGKWRRDFWREYQRENLFAPYIGNGMDAVIHRIYELKDGGEEITVPMVGRLQGAGVTGANTLVGNEEALDQYGQKVRIDWARHAVVLNKKEQRKSAIDQLGVVRPALMDWAMVRLRDDIIRAMHNVGTVSITGTVNGIYYPNASTAQKNTWHDANSDRLLYGAATSNFVAGNHAASLVNVDNAADKLTRASLALLKRRARKASPAIRPIRVEDGREFYIAFAGSNAFRDFAEDMVTVNTAARPREGRGMDNNPIFQDGDEVYRGVIVREVPEMDDLARITGAGAGSINVAPVFLCGAQAVGYAVGQLPQPTERYEDDYQFIKGRGVETAYGVAKIQKQSMGTTTLKDWGIATGYFASVGD